MKAFVASYLALVIGSLCLAPSAFGENRYVKLTPENCAKLFESMRPRAITIDDIISETDALGGRSRIEDCGPGCYEYVDYSSASIPEDQAANERMVAAAYAESLLIKGEGLFLFSRYKGIDVPAYDGLTFELATGEITSRVSLKRGFRSYLLLEDAFIKSFKYSWKGERWKDLAENRARYNRSTKFSYEENLRHFTEEFNKIGRWLLVDDQRIKTRVVFQQPHLRIMDHDLPDYARRLLNGQYGDMIESVTLIEADRVKIIPLE